MTTALQMKMALADLRDGLRHVELWGMLGWHDIRQRYRRSILGPWWLTLSTAIMVTALGFVYHAILRMPLEQYLPFLASGLVTWTLLSTIINDSCQVFILSEQVIRQIRLPFTIHVCRLVWRNVIIFLHNLLIVIVIVAIFGGAARLEAVPLAAAALVAVAVNGVWVGLLLGAFCARFRDIPQIVTSMVQLFFFITPVIWHPSVLPGQQRVITYNPFHHFVEIMRAPLLGAAPPAASWLAVLAITLLGWAATIAFMTRYRRRFAYWL